MPGRPRKELTVGRQRAMVLQYAKSKFASKPDDLLVGHIQVVIGTRKLSAVSDDVNDFRIDRTEVGDDVHPDLPFKRVKINEYLHT